MSTSQSEINHHQKTDAEKAAGVNVVILNWNGKQFLEQFIPPLLESSYSNAHFWLADNASTDDSVDWAKSNFEDLNIEVLEENFGFAKGYNIALQRIHEKNPQKYMLLLNQDVEVEASWLEPLIQRLEGDDSIGAAQPLILDQKAKSEQENKFEYAGAAGGMLDILGYPYCRGRIIDELENWEGQYSSGEIFWASGAALLIRSNIYLSLGGLDERFFAHMEEIDLCWRVQRAGYKVFCETNSRVWHVGGGSLNYGNPKKTYLNFRNNARMLAKNLSIWQLLMIWPLRFSLDIIAAIRDLFGGRAAHARAIIKAIFEVIFEIPQLGKIRSSTKKQIDSIPGPHEYKKTGGLYQGSIMWQFFIRGKKTWKQINPE